MMRTIMRSSCTSLEIIVKLRVQSIKCLCGIFSTCYSCVHSFSLKYKSSNPYHIYLCQNLDLYYCIFYKMVNDPENLNYILNPYNYKDIHDYWSYINSYNRLN